jgi:hypothetical protein
LTLHKNPLSHPRISHTSSEHCTVSTESVSHLHLLVMRMTSPQCQWEHLESWP